MHTTMLMSLLVTAINNISACTIEDFFAFFGSNEEMWPPVTYTEGIPDRKHSGYIQYTYRGLTCMHRPIGGSS